jgi:hypothetical protein
MSDGRSIVKATGVLAACALAASLVGASGASARTQGFYIYNFTSHPLKLVDMLHDKDAWAEDLDAPSHPVIGDVLLPGVDKGPEYDHNHIELKKRRSNYATLWYELPDGKRARVDLFYSEAIDTSSQDWGAGCHFAPYCTVEDYNTVTFLDPPGTVHKVAGDDLQQQAQVLQDLCSRKNLAAEAVTCDFKPTRRDDKAFGAPHLLGAVGTNCGAGEAEQRVKQTDKQSTTNSFGVKVGAEAEAGVIFARAKTSIEFKYGGEWKTEDEFTYDMSHPLPEKWRGWFAVVNPVIRVWGDFTLTIGNTTWILHDVYFDFPDGTRKGQTSWKWDGRPMLPDEVKAECGQAPPNGKQRLGAKRIQRAPARYARVKQRGTRRAETLYGGRESTTLIGRGGGDILLGAAGDDRLLGGPGRDLYRGGPGSDTIIDSRGRTQVSTGKGRPDAPDSVDVRDGKGDDRVSCGDQDAVVKADPGDRVRHCGG